MACDCNGKFIHCNHLDEIVLEHYMKLNTVYIYTVNQIATLSRECYMSQK